MSQILTGATPIPYEMLIARANIKQDCQDKITLLESRRKLYSAKELREEYAKVYKERDEALAEFDKKYSRNKKGQ